MRLVGGASAAESLLKSAADYQGKHVPSYAACLILNVLLGASSASICAWNTQTSSIAFRALAPYAY